MADRAPHKTLVFCFDGTGNEPSNAREFKEDQSVSNVLKLHVLMGGVFAGPARLPAQSAINPRQLNFYYNGIGTRGESRLPLLGDLYTAVRASLNKLVAPSWGDAKHILEDARRHLDANYSTGDKLAVFGYSRGAALARKFASMVLRDYEDRAVDFLGAFDTVAAMDGVHRKGEAISSDVVFENGTLNPRIRRAVHLLAIDEDRVTFTPTLMNRDAAHPDRILEVWFPGVHGDVGGGYWLDGLSDMALAFMIERCKDALGEDIAITKGDAQSVRGLFGQQNAEALSGLDVDDIAVNPLVTGQLHTHGGVQASVLDQEVRSIHVSDDDQPCADLPVLHVSVQRRFSQVPGYRPPALRGLRFKLLFDSGQLSDGIEGVSGLREYRRSGGHEAESAE